MQSVQLITKNLLEWHQQKHKISKEHQCRNPHPELPEVIIFIDHKS